MFINKDDGVGVAATGSSGASGSSRRGCAVVMAENRRPRTTVQVDAGRIGQSVDY